MIRMMKHLREEKEETLNEGRIFTCFYDYDGSSILPNEILVKIFQYLPFTDLRQCALVSKAWRVLSLCPVLWRKFQLKEVTLDVPYLERLVNCGVQQLHMESSKVCVNIQPLETRYFESSTFKTLQYLRMESTYIETDLLEAIVLIVPNLKYFIFKNVGLYEISKIFCALLHLQLLEKLQLIDVTFHFSKIMDLLDKIGIVINLQSLTLSYTLEDCDRIKESATTFVEKYLSLFPNLQCVELESYPISYIDDKIFKHLVQLEHLKSLKVDEIIVSSAVMETLTQTKSFVHLKELSFGCEEMEENSVILLLRASSNVEVLGLNGICLTTAILEALLSLNYLKKLDLCIQRVQSPDIFLHVDKLRKFDNKLSSLFLSNGYHSINVSTILSLFKYLNNLSVSLGYFVEETIIEILKRRNLKALRLNFSCSYCYLGISPLSQVQVEVYELEELRIRFPKFPIEWILSRTPYLKLLEVCDYPLNKEFLLGVSSLKRLEELKCELYDQQEYEDSNFSKLDAKLQLDNLISVDVSYDKYASLPYGLENLLSMCRNVKKLYICEFHVTENLFDIIKTMQELELLEMIEVTMFRDICVTEILEYCPKLTERHIEIEVREPE